MHSIEASSAPQCNDEAARTDVCAGGPEAIADGLVRLDGWIPAYRIADHERLPPFLMTLVSAWEHWMFVSSRGAVAAGRVEPGRSLFPYETDDRLHHAAGVSGPITAIQIVDDQGATTLWEPFDRRREPGVRRHLTKSLAGDRIEFEEVHPTLGLTFRYRWSTCDRFGFVRTATLVRHAGRAPVTVIILDGLLNLMPPHVQLSLQQNASCLVDAYKMAERGPGTLAIYSLTARITDRVEPAEALRGTVAWCAGIEPDAILLSDQQVQGFRDGATVTGDAKVMGRRGAYLVSKRLTLSDDAESTWHIGADSHRSQTDIVALTHALEGLEPWVLKTAIDTDSARLRALIASADGVQTTADPVGDAHHYANVMFNVMRGGIFVDGHHIERADLAVFVGGRNSTIAERHAAALASLGPKLTLAELMAWAQTIGDPSLIRLCYEYLPLTFSRRHGDPSRPWNQFAIRVRAADGSPLLDYAGNWRDIFQNWEALLSSFPGFAESIIAKFVNATTVDGFNPYRLTREGIDWERPDPEDPWANIGYWGDHQTIYLLKLLEASQAFHPAALSALLEAPIYSYADVPYRIAPYGDLLVDPHDTITFDYERDRRIDLRVAALGSDGRLLHDADEEIVHVNLVEKLLVTTLARLSNLVPGGGIWMNTQRPEWNDANNALVGNGLSMVTLCYLRRSVAFFETLLTPHDGGEVALSGQVAAWLDRVASTLSTLGRSLDRPTLSDPERRAVLDLLGTAFSDYREGVYETGLGAVETRPYGRIISLMRTARLWLDHSIRASRRADGLYHAYNLLSLSDDTSVAGLSATVDHLDVMLEGQVAVLSSGRLSAEEASSLVETLFESALYRPDQRSFMLYPVRELPGLLSRGIVPTSAVKANALLAALGEDPHNPLISRDLDGTVRFCADLANAKDVALALDEVAERPAWSLLVQAERDAVLAVYEAVFNHRAFTGRSGTMVAYEGVGSIYWHMVSKLLLAVGEIVQRAEDDGERIAVIARLQANYHAIRAGLSAQKTAAEYGAFPTDPYSHSPGHRGAQQPGMTGQVKEEVLTRWIELGVRVIEGQVGFAPTLLRQSEFDEDGLQFSYCGVPIHYYPGTSASLLIHRGDAIADDAPGNTLSLPDSADLLGRTGAITRVDVTLNPQMNRVLTANGDFVKVTNKPSPDPP